MPDRILIVGDAGRGKTTFAHKLSERLSIPCYSTDDYYWKIKFTEPSDKQKSIEDISQVYAKDKWIVDGSTRHLIAGGLERADVIYLLEFSNISHQYYYLITRHFKRTNESLKGLWDLLKHVTYKKYKKGYGSHMPNLYTMLEPHTRKVVRLASLREIEGELSRLGYPEVSKVIRLS